MPAGRDAQKKTKNDMTVIIQIERESAREREREREREIARAREGVVEEAEGVGMAERGKEHGCQAVEGFTRVSAYSPTAIPCMCVVGTCFVRDP